MSAPTKLFLDRNSIDNRWKVLDKDEFCFGEVETPEQAIQSARVVTNAPIYANSNFNGIIDGEPIINTLDVGTLTEEDTIYGAEYLIEAMAELSGFKVRKVVDDTGFYYGYTMELVE